MIRSLFGSKYVGIMIIMIVHVMHDAIRRLHFQDYSEHSMIYIINN